ncbi:MAG: hypothetical protein HOV82_16800 [Streptomyces sp.]|nr:hypothetical protein [Streptomyces sp.]NUP36166.1 hypothetical protein [Streptomyces sp.]NUS75513.1 hypothetical protein [Streptomyces sp.]
MTSQPITDQQPTNLDLDEIAGRAAGLYEYATGLDAAWQDEADQLAGTDVPALLAEVRRLRDEQPAAPLDRQALAGLTAFHTSKLAATLRLYAPSELPEHQPGIERAIGLLDLHKEQLLAGRWTDDVQRMLTAMLGAVLDETSASLRRDGFGVDEVAEILSVPVSSAAVEQPAEACGKCRRPFDPADTRHDGRARYAETPYCRGCIDLCHEADAFHCCVICQ